jgi:predicted Zn-dependent peptidase
MHQITKIPKGPTVVTAEMPHMASVSLGLWVGIGGRYESAAISGVSHFIEHLLFKGTRRRTALEISQAVEGVGGYLNAFTSEENTCFYSKARHDRLDELLDVLMDMFLRSTFDPVEIEKERGVIKDELAMYLDQPHHYVHELLDATLWPDQPLGRAITGTTATLDGIGREQLAEFQGANYLAENTLVAAAGNLRHEAVVKAVSRYARAFKHGRKPVFQPADAGQTAPRLRFFEKEVEQTQIALAARACSRHDERRYALRLLNTILGENMSSRLFQTVREERGLAYSIYSSLSFFDDAGSLTVSAGVETEKMAEALKLILKEMRSMTQKPPTTAELRRARDYTIGQLELGLENTESRMMWLGEQLLGYGRVVDAEHVKRELAAVKPSDVRTVAGEFFQSDRLNLAVISPVNDAQLLGGLLRL